MNWRKHGFLLAHDLLGSQLRRAYAEYLSLESLSLAALATLREKRLSELLQHAVRGVPFYRERVAPNAGLEQFPILTKDVVREHFCDLMTPDLLAEYKGQKARDRYGWVEVKTGGTTGTPTTVIQDALFRDYGRAGRLYSQYLCGFPIGTPFFQLWGSMRDINSQADSLQKRILNGFLQPTLLNAFRMDAARMCEYLDVINKSSIKHFMAYVDAADALARFAEREKISVRPLRSIAACAGTVTDDVRGRLTRVFGATVHNKYGSRECADMACECSRGGIHIYVNAVHLEVVNAGGQPAKDGENGRLLVTLLHNKRFPVIRYEIGDIGSLRAGTCACGSPLPMLGSIEGRSVEFITSADGAYVSPVTIRHFIGVVHNPGGLRRFQLVQSARAKYHLTLEFEPDFSGFEAFMQKLAADLVTILGAGAELTFERVDLIPESASGKFRYVRNMWNEVKGTPQSEG